MVIHGYCYFGITNPMVYWMVLDMFGFLFLRESLKKNVRKGNRWQDALILLAAMPSQTIRANIFSDWEPEEDRENRAEMWQCVKTWYPW